MKNTNLILGIGIFFLLSAQVQASDLSCDLALFPVNDKIQNAQKFPLSTTIPPNAAPGTVEAKPTFTFGDYQISLVIRVNTQIDPSKPVDLFNDYYVWYRYNVYKIEGKYKRAVASGSVGSITATESKNILGCESTVCATTSPQNVDIATALANLNPPMNANQAYKAGLIPGETPAAFFINCKWNK